MSLINGFDQACEHLNAAGEQFFNWISAEVKRLEEIRSPIIRAVTDRIVRLARKSSPNHEEIAKQRLVLEVIGMTQEDADEAIAHASVRDIFDRIAEGTAQVLFDVAKQLANEGLWRSIDHEEYEILWEINTDTLDAQKLPRSDPAYNASIAGRKIEQTVSLQCSGDEHHFAVRHTSLERLAAKMMIQMRDRLKELRLSLPRPSSHAKKGGKKVPPMNNLGDKIRAASNGNGNGAEA